MCVSAAHEVAVLISGSRWRASKWESQSGSMYVRNKRMTLAESQLCSSHKKHTLLWPFPSVCLFASLCHTHTHTALLLHIPICSVTAGDNIHFSTVSLHQKEKKKEPFVRHSLRRAGSYAAPTSRWLDTQSFVAFTTVGWSICCEVKMLFHI